MLKKYFLEKLNKQEKGQLLLKVSLAANSNLFKKMFEFELLFEFKLFDQVRIGSTFYYLNWTFESKLNS